MIDLVVSALVRSLPLARAHLRAALAFLTVLLVGCTHTETGTAVVSVNAVTLTPTAPTLFVGDSTRLTATIADVSGNALSGRKVTWVSTDTSIATVSDSGYVRGRTAGVTIITATSEGVSATVGVTIYSAAAKNVATVRILPSDVRIGIGGSRALVASLTDTLGAPITGTPALWTSSNAAIVSVATDGTITGVATGSATITATVGVRSGTATITVVTALTTSAPVVTVAPALTTLGIGGTATLAATYTDSLGASFPEVAATWSSSNPAVVSVSGSGVLTGHGAGTVIITARFNGAAGLTTARVVVLDFVAVSAGGVHSCARTGTGAVWCWGGNLADQLGDGSAVNWSVPVPPATARAFSTIAAGYANSCGIATDASAWCWGDNGSGNLGDGTATHRNTPVRVAGGLTLAALALGRDQSCGLTTTGSAWCWGDGSNGTLGQGSTSSSTLPVPVSGGLRFATIGVGDGVACALTTDGTAYCWGRNDLGQIGNGGGVNVSTPTRVSTTTRFVSLAVGSAHVCGVGADGSAWCWGANDTGQLGDGTTSARATPARVSGGLPFTTITAGLAHSCALTTDGAAYCWGDDVWGQLGDGSGAVLATAPVAVAGGRRFRLLSAGAYHSCGIAVGSGAFCWGDNGQGQLGDGTTDIRATPVRVAFQP